MFHLRIAEGRVWHGINVLQQAQEKSRRSPGALWAEMTSCTGLSVIVLAANDSFTVGRRMPLQIPQTE